MQQPPGAASTSTPTVTTANNAATAVGNNEPALRACNATTCKVGKYVEVAKRKCSQFVTAPYIMPKPILVNGKTAIFQVGGEMAKMGDIPTLPGAHNEKHPIYRIKPGTHAHIINYVLIDEGSDSMEKAKSGDQEALRMLLEAQRESATTKLQRLIANHRGTGANAVAAPIRRTSVPISTTSTVTAISNPSVTTPQIHPDFSIASVEGAVPFASPNITSASTNTPSELPSTPVILTQSSAADTSASVSELQAEVLELRRTVALMQSAKGTSAAQSKAI